MRQKYLVGKDEGSTETIIREMAELEKNEFSAICEKSYKTKDLKKALAADGKTPGGFENLVPLIRQPDFFPPHAVAEKIAETIQAFLETPGDEWVEVLLDELECSREAEADLVEEIDDDDLDDDSDIDELLEDDLKIEGDATDADIDDDEDNMD